MSEQQPQPISAESGSVSASDTGIEPVMTESPAIAPDQELTSPKPDAPKVEPRIEAPKAKARTETTREAPRPAANVTIMAPGERMWTGETKPAAEAPAKRRIGAMAAVIALAALAGAVGGALATTGFGQGNAASAARNAGLESAIARIDADILALKASVEQNARLGVTQFNKTSDRLDKVEKAQAEPSARLAKLSDEVSKLRTAQAAAAAPAAAPAASVHAAAAPRDVTGSVASAAPANEAPPPKVEVGRLPTVEGWVLRDASRGAALIENRRGVYEVFAGDTIPGLGRVDAIRKQDGRWVVVTSKGLIVAR